jgi:sigma-B regulation protein RsbU (phosphoserine phosphatase)
MPTPNFGSDITTALLLFGMTQAPIKVLLVEDNPGDALLVRAALGASERGRFELTVAGRLAACVERAKADAPDVLLLDLGLPESQGLETFVRLHAAVPDFPIIVLSGLEDEQTALECVHQGAQDYLLKGAAMHDVLPRAIRYALERHRSNERLALLARELQEKNQELEEELRMAREIQQALLPSHYPLFHDRSGSRKNVLRFAHCYRPATALSGDFFNVARLSDTEAGVLICDVMGHGVRAALIGALARGLIDQFKSVALEPGKFLTNLNRGLAAILEQSDIDAFASAFYLVADVANRQVRYANAGHPKALMLHRDKGVVEWLNISGPSQMPLGLRADTVYRDAQTELAGRDSLLLLTDGIYEEENNAGEQFGHERLIDAVKKRLDEPCDKLLGALVRDTQQFAGHEDFSDDVCLVGIDVVNGTGRK